MRYTCMASLKVTIHAVYTLQGHVELHKRRRDQECQREEN